MSAACVVFRNRILTLAQTASAEFQRSSWKRCATLCHSVLLVEWWICIYIVCIVFICTCLENSSSEECFVVVCLSMQLILDWLTDFQVVFHLFIYFSGISPGWAGCTKCLQQRTLGIPGAGFLAVQMPCHWANMSIWILVSTITQQS